MSYSVYVYAIHNLLSFMKPREHRDSLWRALENPLIRLNGKYGELLSY